MGDEMGRYDKRKSQFYFDFLNNNGLAKGTAGPQGPQGEQGERGPRGWPGAQGPPGKNGAITQLIVGSNVPALPSLAVADTFSALSAIKANLSDKANLIRLTASVYSVIEESEEAPVQLKGNIIEFHVRRVPGGVVKTIKQSDSYAMNTFFTAIDEPGAGRYEYVLEARLVSASPAEQHETVKDVSFTAEIVEK
ncbi:collagen-like protein [Bacillus sp. 1P06AnD]|uniref:collagen-like triple helix repeat-containing protein n=1 Tax=Bacillus sp. 1P06AnD TaxID=3132208 RepID=UPI0039A36D57